MIAMAINIPNTVARILFHKAIFFPPKSYRYDEQRYFNRLLLKFHPQISLNKLYSIDCSSFHVFSLIINNKYSFTF